MYRKIACICIVILLLTTTSFGQAAEASQARMDAERDAKSDVNSTLWMGAGCLIGVIGVLVAYVVEPSPPAARLMGKSSDYVMAYTDTYKSTAKSAQGRHAITGCVVGTLLEVGIYVLVIAAAASQSTY